jgi:hypothetical protein
MRRYVYVKKEQKKHKSSVRQPRYEQSPARHYLPCSSATAREIASAVFTIDAIDMGHVKASLVIHRRAGHALNRRII